LEHIDKVSSQ